MFEIKFSKDVVKFVKNSQPEFRKRYIESFEILSLDPNDNKLDIKPLKNKTGHYRLRIGKFRFLYEIMPNNLIFFYKADSRGQVYK
jgi:mRNA interferase RelE/StbE